MILNLTSDIHDYALLGILFAVVEFDTRLQDYPTYRPDLAHFDRALGQCYDHIWVAAIALDCADKKLREMGRFPESLTEIDSFYDYEKLI